MIKKMVIALVAMLVIGCKNENQSTQTATSKEIAKFSPEVEESAVIYEVNISNIHQKELLMHLQKTFHN